MFSVFGRSDFIRRNNHGGPCSAGGSVPTTQGEEMYIHADGSGAISWAARS